ncbi:hypothetical protein ACNHE5_20475 [Pandoraea pnomenusa]|uniref:hypothetical protein n=1 Tax=Pandoraea pnomenusa TaxID=93220 RepID=UPI003CEECD76
MPRRSVSVTSGQVAASDNVGHTAANGASKVPVARCGKIACNSTNATGNATTTASAATVTAGSRRNGIIVSAGR